MDKREVLRVHEADHQKMAETTRQLSEEEMTQETVLGDWTVKDILAHLSAWAWDCRDEIERVLKDRATWHKFYETTEGEDEFNKREVKKRREKSLDEVVQEWEDSFQALIKKMKELSDEEWNHQSHGDAWSDGRPLAVESLFAYEYKGEGHEAGHAKEIKEHFGLT